MPVAVFLSICGVSGISFKPRLLPTACLSLSSKKWSSGRAWVFQGGHGGKLAWTPWPRDIWSNFWTKTVHIASPDCLSGLFKEGLRGPVLIIRDSQLLTSAPASGCRMIIMATCRTIATLSPPLVFYHGYMTFRNTLALLVLYVFEEQKMLPEFFCLCWCGLVGKTPSLDLRELSFNPATS